MSTVESPTPLPHDMLPVTLPVTVQQYAELVDQGLFENSSGQIELINGRIVQMNPQGPQHSDPIDLLGEWSAEQSNRRYRIRIEKPIVLPNSSSTPEPDIAWVTRKSYAVRHPGPEDIVLLIEASVTSITFDLGEKCDVYASAGVPEYWQINVPRRELRVHRNPVNGIFRTITTHPQNDSIAPLCLPTATLQIAHLFPPT